MDFEKIILEAQLKRRQKVFPKLKDGYKFKADGRSGYVYYKEESRIIEIPWEMSGVPQYDILISHIKLKSWTIPESEPISSEKRDQIIEGLKQYLRSKRLKSDLE